MFVSKYILLNNDKNSETSLKCFKKHKKKKKMLFGPLCTLGKITVMEVGPLARIMYCYYYIRLKYNDKSLHLLKMIQTEASV